jgi:hypothetical protein
LLILVIEDFRQRLASVKTLLEIKWLAFEMDYFLSNFCKTILSIKMECSLLMLLETSNSIMYFKHLLKA